MRTAFKEWAIVVDALARGDQIVILRKGGIHEGKGGFRLDHASFLLFPTRFHQQREGVVESAQTRFDELSTSWPPPDRVRIELVAEVVGSRWLPDRAEALSLRGEHVWRDEVLGDPSRAYGAPDLVVEVLSPSTRRLDVTAKRRVYSRAGVRELWFVDVEERSLEVWRRGPRALVRRETLGADDVLASDVVPGYRVRVGLLFAYLDA